jgi:DNA replicative helicase MCM subunit Mcm2 (Cdc46/Mcm family)
MCCALDEACQALMKTAMRQLRLTARAFHRVLKLSRTIADLSGSEAITQVHLAEALKFQLEVFVGVLTNETDASGCRVFLRRGHLWKREDICIIKGVGTKVLEQSSAGGLLI